MAAAQPVSAQSTSYCLDSRETLTDVACLRVVKPVGQTYLCPKPHSLRAQLTNGNTRILCRWEQGS